MTTQGLIERSYESFQSWLYCARWRERIKAELSARVKSSVRSRAALPSATTLSQ